MLNQTDILEVIADPIVQTGLLATVGALVTGVFLRGQPTRRLVGQLSFFLALTVLLLRSDRDNGFDRYTIRFAAVPILNCVSAGL
jgi:hypothetical protein